MIKIAPNNEIRGIGSWRMNTPDNIETTVFNDKKIEN